MLENWILIRGIKWRGYSNVKQKVVIIANVDSMWGTFTNLNVDANNIINIEEYKLSYELIDGHWAGRGIYTIVTLCWIIQGSYLIK